MSRVVSLSGGGSVFCLCVRGRGGYGYVGTGRAMFFFVVFFFFLRKNLGFVGLDGDKGGVVNCLTSRFLFVVSMG